MEDTHAILQNIPSNAYIRLDGTWTTDNSFSKYYLKRGLISTFNIPDCPSSTLHICLVLILVHPMRL